MNIFMRSADEQSQMDEFEEVFCYVVAELTFCINIRTAETNTQMLYVRKEDFPRFNGRYDMWKQFEYFYTIVIHNNKILSNKTKFELLIELLSNEPRSIIDDISLSDANYIDAWLQIKSHYNSPKFIINMIVKNVLDQPCVKSGDVGQLKQLLEVTEGAIRNLHALGNEAQTPDQWLIGILLHKLDIFTQRMWMSELNHLDFATLTDFMKFLNVRMQMLMGYRYVCPPKKQVWVSVPTGVRKLHSLDNCQRQVPSIIITKEQESCTRHPNIESNCKPNRNTTLKDDASSGSPNKDQKLPSRRASNASERRPGQLNGEQPIECHDLQSPLTAAAATARITGAIKKLKAITMGTNSGSSEFLV